MVERAPFDPLDQLGKIPGMKPERVVTPETHHRLLALINNLTRNGVLKSEDNLELRSRVLTVTDETEIHVDRVLENKDKAADKEVPLAARIYVILNADKVKKGETARATIYFVLRTAGKIVKARAIPFAEMTPESLEKNPAPPQQQIEGLMKLLETFQENADQTHLEE